MDSLIKLLKGNARLSNEQLAVMLGVTPEEVAARIADYEKRGVIKGYSVILNEELADKNAVTAFIEVKVTPKADFGFDELARTIMMYDEVDSVTLMSGSLTWQLPSAVQITRRSHCLWLSVCPALTALYPHQHILCSNNIRNKASLSKMKPQMKGDSFLRDGLR